MKFLILLALVASAYSAFFEPGAPDLPVYCLVSPGMEVKTFGDTRRTITNPWPSNNIIAKFAKRDEKCQFKVKAATSAVGGGCKDKVMIDWILVSLNPKQGPKLGKFHRHWTFSPRERKVFWERTHAGGPLKTHTIPWGYPDPDARPGHGHCNSGEDVVEVFWGYSYDVVKFRSNCCQYAINWYPDLKWSFIEVFVGRHMGPKMFGACGAS